MCGAYFSVAQQMSDYCPFKTRIKCRSFFVQVQRLLNFEADAILLSFYIHAILFASPTTCSET